MFSINWIDSRRTVINLDFRKPEYVSSFPTKDRLKVRFNDTSIFKTESGAPIDENVVLEFELPRQNAKWATKVYKNQMITIARTVARATLIMQFGFKALAN